MNVDLLLESVPAWNAWREANPNVVPNLGRANLRSADLRSADLRGANLRWANLIGANLGRADLRRADLRWAYLTGADLAGADLAGADLREADLRRADLRWAYLGRANLTGADLAGADLREADLRRADLRWANLGEANLGGADLAGADLSGAVGLTSPIDWLAANAEPDQAGQGYIFYKSFNTVYRAAPHWQIERGSILTEVVNFDRTMECGCGVNFAVRSWFKDTKGLWRVLIRWEWLAGVCVPYGTDGKARCEKLELLEQVV